ncbi:MAG TPA: malto-oligosyltrehalose trehalohydrolase [Deltaproteobacteria bacterium]|nr:malto-oligosyltrehalose trehalohydrolase [Deltaproteobacteria bacterium]
MIRLRIWAPHATRVEVESEGQRLVLQPVEGGFYEGDAPWLVAGRDYAFRLDEGELLPDPRAERLRRGVHAPGQRLDHSQYAWQDADWQPPSLSTGVVYELHVGTFTPKGTFEAALEKLAHLRKLGVTHVELMPVHSFSGEHGWGYDGVGLFAPHEPYGGPEGLKKFVETCHAHGLAVLLDVVYNHLGPDGNYLSRFGPYFTDRYATPWGPAVNLDGSGSDEVRRFLLDNARMWLRDYHLDGLRLDAVHALFDRSALHLLEELQEEVASLQLEVGRSLVLVAESDLNDPRLVRARQLGGFGLAAQWSDDFHHALHALLTHERQGYYRDFGPAADLAAALTKGFVYDGRYSRHRGRRHGRSAKGLSGHRFLVYTQNHDQIGNRARGERTSHLLSTSRLRIAAALLFTAPFVPLLFQGEEWGAKTPFLYFTDFRDPALGRAVHEGRRRESSVLGRELEEVPDPQDRNTFVRSKLDWSELEREPHASLLQWHRDLIQLRRAAAALRDDRLDRVLARFDEDESWLVVERGPWSIVCNLSGLVKSIPLSGDRPTRPWLAAPARPVVGGNAIELEGAAVAILGPDALDSGL